VKKNSDSKNRLFRLLSDIFSKTILFHDMNVVICRCRLSIIFPSIDNVGQTGTWYFTNLL